MTDRRQRRGTKANPFVVGERVRTRYYRGAAPERERTGKVKKVSCFAGHMSFGHKENMRYKVDWDDEYEPYSSRHAGQWLTCRSLEAIDE